MTNLTLPAGMNFVVDYKINNPADTATYYVRALIKNAATGATIATLPLTDQGSKYFKATWAVPTDPSGVGMQITIFRTVYDDAGYTTESVIYGTQVDTFIIQNPMPVGLGSSGGESFDYKYVKRLIEEAIAKHDEKIFDELRERTGLSLVSSIEEVMTLVSRISKNQDRALSSVKSDLAARIDAFKKLLPKEQKGYDKEIRAISDQISSLERQIAEINSISKDDVTKIVEGIVSKRLPTLPKETMKLLEEFIGEEKAKLAAIDEAKKPDPRIGRLLGDSSERTKKLLGYA